MQKRKNIRLGNQKQASFNKELPTAYGGAEIAIG
jgi:hypothetical protein